jgi:hypothetical protein
MKFSPDDVSESDECNVLCEWAALHPHIGNYLISIPNQAICYTNPGVRKKMSRQGVKKGIPDYFLAIPKEGWFSGLFIEMKRKGEKGKKLRIEQEEWQIKLTDKGYKSVFCYGADEAIEIIEKYMGLP